MRRYGLASVLLRDRRTIGLLALLVPFSVMCIAAWAAAPGVRNEGRTAISGIIKLPKPEYRSATSVEEALLKRRSVRAYSDKPMTLSQVSQLLWAAQGITGESGFRTAPSAGALYPLELYIVAGHVDDLPAGTYKYNPHGHELSRIAGGDERARLCNAALGQPAVRKAAAVIVIAAVYGRTTAKYGERGIRYVHIEAGHAAENVYLQAVSLDLGTVVIGAFHDEAVKKAVGLPRNEEPVCIMPVGRR
jgi:SagB-type dehydrogenase family enzyme